jgi:hypothetical protein
MTYDLHSHGSANLDDSDASDFPVCGCPHGGCGKRMGRYEGHCRAARQACCVWAEADDQIAVRLQPPHWCEKSLHPTFNARTHGAFFEIVCPPAQISASFMPMPKRTSQTETVEGQKGFKPKCSRHLTYDFAPVLQRLGGWAVMTQRVHLRGSSTRSCWHGIHTTGPLRSLYHARSLRSGEIFCHWALGSYTMQKVPGKSHAFSGLESCC